MSNKKRTIAANKAWITRWDNQFKKDVEKLGKKNRMNKKMTNRERLTAIALKAWATRRKNAA